MLRNASAMIAEREALRMGIEHLTVLFPTEVSSFDFQVECTDRTVQYKLNAQSLRLFGLHRDVNDAHRAGANRLQNKFSRISKVTKSVPRAREAPTAGESAKCARHSRGEDALTKGKGHEGSMKTTAKDGKLHNSRLQQTQDRGTGRTEASEHLKALTCGEHGKTLAGEAGKPRSVQQKSMHRKRDKPISQKDGFASEAPTCALG